MSFPHHESEEMARLQKRFLDQVAGTARREYPQGRMGAQDDGELAFAITTDDRHRTIVIRFGKAVEWVAFGVTEAEELRDQLTERINYLRTGVKLCEPC